MNPMFDEPSALGRPFVKDKILARGPLELGSVVTFAYSGERLLHMIICHTMEDDGWKNSAQYLRFGLDHLWHEYQLEKKRQFSVVSIGRGTVGRRMNAPYAEIMKALADSHLAMAHWVFNTPRDAVPATNIVPLRLLRMWEHTAGLQEIGMHQLAA